MENEIFPGTRVMVFDHLLFLDDKKTPLSTTTRPATVVCRYGKKHFDRFNDCFHIYPDLVDVEFDHRPGKVSEGHFTSGIRQI